MTEEARDLEDGESKRLAGDRPAMSATPPDLVHAFNSGHRSSLFRRLHRGTFAAWTSADDDNVVVVAAHADESFCDARSEHSGRDLVCGTYQLRNANSMPVIVGMCRHQCRPARYLLKLRRLLPVSSNSPSGVLCVGRLQVVLDHLAERASKPGKMSRSHMPRRFETGTKLKRFRMTSKRNSTILDFPSGDLSSTGSFCPVADDTDSELSVAFDELLKSQSVSWTDRYSIKRILGSGGQGVVYLADRIGAANVAIPVALKMFTPKRYATTEAYQTDMARIARISGRLAVIQQDHLLDIHNIVDRGGIYVMVMEWVDGFDLATLLEAKSLERTRDHVSDDQWKHFRKVIFNVGPAQTRLTPGIAVSIVRECLNALRALHTEGIVHADVKPSNIMLKLTGNVKLIDLGAAFEFKKEFPPDTVTPRYAAPELLRGEVATPLSDLASLGYVLIEMLSGVPIFTGLHSYRELLRAKERISTHLYEILPDDIVASELLLDVIRGLVAPDPADRFPSAEAADLVNRGAADFSRQLVTGNLASEYTADLRSWLRVLASVE